MSSSGVCIISQYWDPDINGDVVRLRLAIQALRNLGHKVTLITSTPHYPDGDRKGSRVRLYSVERTVGMTTVRVRMPSLPHSGLGQRMALYIWFAALSSFPAIVFGRGKYVWAFSQRVFSTYTALLAHFVWGARVVSDVTDIWPEALANTGYANAGSLFYRVATAVSSCAFATSSQITTLTPAMKQMLVEIHGQKGGKVVVLPVTSSAHASVVPRGKGKLRILYFGNIGSNYDFDVALKIAMDMKGMLELELIGSGELLDYIHAKIASLGIDNVTVTGATLGGDDLWQAAARADAFILPMRKGPFPDASFPTKFVDYLALGKPVIYIGEGYLANLISASGVGAVGRAGDLAGLEEYLRNIAASPELGEVAGVRAKELAATMFSWDAFESQIASVFR